MGLFAGVVEIKTKATMTRKKIISSEMTSRGLSRPTFSCFVDSFRLYLHSISEITTPELDIYSNPVMEDADVIHERLSTGDWHTRRKGFKDKNFLRATRCFT